MIQLTESAFDVCCQFSQFLNWISKTIVMKKTMFAYDKIYCWFVGTVELFWTRKWQYSFV